MRTTGVLKIVKSVSRVLKTEAVFIYVTKGTGKKRGKREGKMYTINFTFRRPGAATRVGIPLTLMSIMSFAVGRVLRTHINTRPLQSIVAYNITYIMYSIISFFSVTQQLWRFDVYSMQTRIRLSVVPDLLWRTSRKHKRTYRILPIQYVTYILNLCSIFHTSPPALHFQHPPYIIPTLNTRPP